MTTNHPANGPVSLDRLHQIREILSKAAAQSDGGNLGYAMADAVKVIDGVIAAFDAEPVAWRYRYVKKGITDSQGEPWVGDWKYMPTKEDCNDRPSYEIQALYASPPAPVVPDEMYWQDAPVEGSTRAAAYATGWNACRAAILQAGNSPVTPDGYVLVPKEITCAMDDAAWEAYHETRCMSDIWAALLASAPQQEVK